MANGVAVGRVKAFEMSPTLGTGIGYVLFETPAAMSVNAFTVKGRDGSEHPLALHKLPFFDTEKSIPRGLEVMEF